MARVFSGVQPTGEGPHIGNYIGAFRRWVDLQDSADESFYCVVDLHAMTMPWDPKELAEGVRRTAATLIATGIDPERSVLFVQSDVPEHTELAWILTCLARMGELGRMTQFKDKSRGGEAESIGAGLLVYPVLMAADVLAYRADRVPVGDDQRQHLELMRDLAMRFNRRFGETFPAPEAVIGRQGARIMSLDDPSEKMSKSSGRPGSLIGMLDAPAVVRSKIARAVTDSGREITYGPDKPAVSNLLDILAAMTGTPVADLVAGLEGQGYAKLKSELTDAVVAVLEPFQERYGQLMGDPAMLDKLLDEGAGRARAVAQGTMATVRERVGLRPGGVR
ncbi:MAG TPA: tryptophan--tRNA ligase [Actinomycetota bacterium]|nr:tryptophan--tRNA ligase [Actinomycetota bacterium]